MGTAPRSATPAGRVIVDYTSPDGRTVTHIRGLLLVNYHYNLRTLNLEERFFAALPASAREECEAIIASSWVDIEVALRHFQAFDALEVPQEQVEELGRPLANRIAETWYGALVKNARNAGIEAMGTLLRQNDRSFSRMYKGGCTTVIEHGPKEMTIEDHGNPLLSSRCFRTGYLGYMRGLAALLTKSAFVKAVPMQVPDPHGIATRFSWV